MSTDVGVVVGQILLQLHRLDDDFSRVFLEVFIETSSPQRSTKASF